MKTNLLKSIFISLILMMGVSNAWAYNQSAVDLYFDNSTSQWSECYVSVGHTGWTAFYDMERVSGTQYLWKLPSNFNGGNAWGGASGWVVSKDKWDGYPKAEDITVKYVWHGDKNVTKLQTSAWANTKIYKADGTESVSKDGTTKTVYKVTSSTKSDYTVTINSPTGGTLTVKDYDNTTVTSGTKKVKLTVLKFSATPADGYVLDAVEINDGTNTTTIAAADLATTTHTLKSNVTINPVWRATTSTVTVTTSATNGTVTGGGTVEEGTSVTLTATPNAGYQFVNWTVGGAEVSTANPYTFTAEEDVTVVANFEETPKTTIYFVNNKNWSKVNVYGWEGSKGENPGWPGADITANKLGEQIGGFDVYSYTVEQGSYGKVIFNNGSAQTANFVWTDGKYYYMGADLNYAGGTKDEVTEAVAPDPLATEVYLAGDMNSWSATENEFRKATGEATTASVTVALTAKTYEFQLVIGGTYYGNTGTMKRGGDAVHEGGWSFEDTSYGANCKIVADIAGDYTFTWNLDTKKLTVTYPPLPKHQVTATVNPAESGTVTGIGEYEQGSEATLVATPAANYAFKNWTVGGTEKSEEATYTFTVTEAIELVANFVPEKTNDVTISYLCNSNPIAGHTPQTLAVGITTPSAITAPEIDGYYFSSWSLGTGVKSTDETANPISITTLASGEYTLTANYEKERCVYFVNTARWTTVNIYAWASSDDQNKNGNWPGKAMTKETEKISGYDVYKYVMPASKNFDKIIFNNKVDDNGEQTGDLEWVDGKYYVYSAEQWVDKNEVADLLPKPVIYFKNHLGWTNVYVYFFEGDNWGDNGASPWNLTQANGRVCKMEKVGETDIYKFDYSGKDFVPSNVIAFSKDDQSGYGNFHGTEAVYRTDYNPSMELYIPQKTSSETKNSTKYFNKGLWMKYNSTESGYELAGTMLDKDWKVYEPFTASAPGSYHFDIALSLSGNHTYEFQVKNIKNDWYGKQNTKINATKNDLVLEQGSGDTYNIKLTTTSAGNYIFSIDLSEGTMKVSVEYPLQVNDYRMVYIESETKDTKTYTKFHPAQSIRYQAEGEKKDTVSFYINKTAGKNPAILLQKCTAISGANFTWEDVAIQYINGNGGADPALAQAPARKAASITYVDGCTAVTGNGVYNFVMQQTNGSAAFVTGATHPYTGNYYIRTDGAEGGWRKYNTNPDNIMTHSETALTHGGYDYYFCEWMLKNSNVKYVVANDYNYCVSDTLAKDDIVTDENGNLPADANVRYTWNSSTNALKRAYINGSGIAKDRYLVLEGNDKLQDASGNVFPEGTGELDGLKANETTFADMGNWLYQVDVKASEATLVKLTANYNGTIQYFKGDADPDSVVNIITGATNYYKFRLIYDFKTNYLLCGLIEDGNINEIITVDEAMISRSHHDPAQTFQVASGKSITTIKTVYGVMNFNKSTLNGAGSEHERALYWVSFPFDVDLGKAFGFGNYGEHWIMEYYDGAARAKNGWWVDSDTYWEYIWDPKGKTLEAGKGYVLCLDLDLLKESASLWDNTDDIALYFPSKAENITIDDKPASKETKVDAWECTIARDDRKTKDSNWNIIGVPSYANISDFSTKIDDVNFYYQYNAADNSYISQEATTFNTMHAYMTQFAGTIQWAYKTVVPAQMAARKQSAGKDQYTLRLALQQEGTDHDHTFIRLQEDNATAEFDMNYDLCKIINRGANIYSMIGNVEVAANVLPVEERVIPLGLDIEEDGNYTFAMPDGTDGITAILIDYETGKETNLLLADYTVELNAGIDNERFALRVRPSYVATEVENTILTDGNDNVKKYIIDGALYLLRDGKLYDAQGRMIQQ